MFIENLYLENYGAYQKANFDFKQGFNVLSGRTGQGKSHIIRAINYALLNKTFGTIEDDCNWSADYFIIKLTVQHNNKTFKIHINYSRKGGAEKELWIDKDYYSGNSDVTSKLSEYFDPSLTQAGIMSLQGKMDVVDATDSERRENLKKIYDLDFSKQVESLKEEIQEVESQKAEIDKEIYNLENKEYNFQETQNEPFTASEYKNKQTELESLRNEKALYDEKIKRRKEVEQRVDELKEELAEAEKKLTNANHSLENKQKELKEKQYLLDDVVEERATRQKELQEELDGIQLKRLPKFDEDELMGTNNYKISLENNIKHLKEKIVLINKGQCPTCGRDFHTNDKDEWNQKLSESEQKLAEVTAKYEQLREDKKDYEQKKEEQEKRKNRKKELEAELSNLNESFDLKESTTQESIDRYIKDIEEIDKNIKEYSNKFRKLKAKLGAESEKLEESVEKKDFDTPIRTLEREIKDYDTVVQKNEIIEQRNKELEEQQKTDKETLELKYKEKDKLNNTIQEYKTGVEILRKEFPNYVISTMVGEIETGMNILLDSAYSGRYNVNIKENRKGLSVTYGSKEKSIRLASGGEKNLFNIGFKNAFSEIAGLKMLLLDESDTYMDDEIAKQTFTIINGMMESETLEQVIMITHKDIVKELVEADFQGKIFQIEEGAIINE